MKENEKEILFEKIFNSHWVLVSRDQEMVIGKSKPALIIELYINTKTNEKMVVERRPNEEEERRYLI